MAGKKHIAGVRTRDHWLQGQGLYLLSHDVDRTAEPPLGIRLGRMGQEALGLFEARSPWAPLAIPSW